MGLTAFEVYKTENRTLNYNKTVKTDGNCTHYRKCFQVCYNWGHNILKRFIISVEVCLTKTKEVCDIQYKNIVTEILHEAKGVKTKDYMKIGKTARDRGQRSVFLSEIKL